jgi:hypothetical protein
LELLEDTIRLRVTAAWAAKGDGQFSRYQSGQEIQLPYNQVQWIDLSPRQRFSKKDYSIIVLLALGVVGGVFALFKISD